MISYNFGSNYRNVEARQNDELSKEKLHFCFVFNKLSKSEEKISK